MDAKELRIGNIVFFGIVLEPIAMKKIDPESPNILMAEPIQLTEEWLRKFGFEDKDYKDGYIGKDFKAGNAILDFVLSKPEKIGEHQKHYAFELRENRYKEVAYVHQLQNLYHALTGHELNLK